MVECGALPMSLPAMFFRIPLGAGFAGDIMFLPSRSWDIGEMLCPYWARYFTLKGLQT